MAGGTDDAQLMTRYAAGDVAAFEMLYARHKGPLYRYFLRQCGSAPTAEELYQEVWVRVIKARGRYEPRARFTTYLYQIAHNCLVDYFRKAGRSLTDGHTAGVNLSTTEQSSGPLADQSADPVAEESEPAFASARWSLVDWEQGPEDPSPGPEAQTAGAQLVARLRLALDALPLDQREAFLLHEEAEMGLAEIAAVTGTNAETVKSRLRYAVKKLRSSLGDLTATGSPRVLT